MSIACPQAWENGECRFPNADGADICCNPSSTCCDVAKECVLSGWAMWLSWPILIFSMSRRLRKYLSRHSSEKDDENINSMSLRNKIKLYWGILSIFLIALIDDIIAYPNNWLPYFFYGFGAALYFGCDYWKNGSFYCNKNSSKNATVVNQVCLYWTAAAFTAFFLCIIKAIDKSKEVAQFQYCTLQEIILSFVSSLTWFSSIAINDIEGIIHLILVSVCKCEISGCNNCCLDGLDIPVHSTVTATATATATQIQMNDNININSNQLPDGLPDGWIEIVTPDGRIYYQNNITKQTQWEKPNFLLYH